MTDAIEWAWTLVNLAGVAFLSLVLRELANDRAAARIPANGNGRRGIWVRLLTRHTVAFLAIQLLFLWAGVAAILRPNTAETQQTDIGGLIAIAVALVMDGITLLDLRDRRKIRTYTLRANDR